MQVMKSSASQKFGMEMPRRERTRLSISLALLRLTAEMVPAGKAISSTITIATAVNCNMIERLCPISVLTYAFVISETPKSPRMICPSQRT